MSKILVSGADGMLGSAVKKVFRKHDLVLTDIDTLDVRDYRKLEKAFLVQAPDVVLHLAALTDLEQCDQFEPFCYETNCIGTMNIAKLAGETNTTMVYISTAGIFDGRREQYAELDTPNPLNHYGRSKLYGEYAVHALCYQHYIIRAGWMMGGGPKIDKKFINKVVKQIQKGAKVIYALTDYYGSPTYTMDFAATILEMIENEPAYGIWHAGGEGRTSRYEVACEMMRVLGLDKKIKVVGVQNDYFKKEFPCLRSKGEVLNNFKLRSVNMSKMRDWKIGLGEYLRKEFLPLCRTL